MLELAAHGIVRVLSPCLWLPACTHPAWDLKPSFLPSLGKSLVNPGTLANKVLELVFCLIPTKHFGLA